MGSRALDNLLGDGHVEFAAPKDWQGLPAKPDEKPQVELVTGGSGKEIVPFHELRVGGEVVAKVIEDSTRGVTRVIAEGDITATALEEASNEAGLLNSEDGREGVLAGTTFSRTHVGESSGRRTPVVAGTIGADGHETADSRDISNH